MQTHKDTFPNIPSLGQALSNIRFDVPVPKLGAPDDGGDDSNGNNNENPRFIKDATVLSPLITTIS